MPKPKNQKELQAENKLLREIIKNNRTKNTTTTIPAKVAAVEAHKEIITSRNIGAIGIGALILSLMVLLIHNLAGTITAMVGIGVLAWFTSMRVKAAQYLEQKYGIQPKPILNPPPKPPQNQPNFKGV